MIQTAVRSDGVVIVLNELFEQPFEASFIERDNVIKKLSAQDADEPLDKWILCSVTSAWCDNRALLPTWKRKYS